MRAPASPPVARLVWTKSESAALTPRRFPQGAGSERLEAKTRSALDEPEARATNSHERP
jgi:hypothetical protein